MGLVVAVLGAVVAAARLVVVRLEESERAKVAAASVVMGRLSETADGVKELLGGLDGVVPLPLLLLVAAVVGASAAVAVAVPQLQLQSQSVTLQEWKTVLVHNPSSFRLVLIDLLLKVGAKERRAVEGHALALGTAAVVAAVAAVAVAVSLSFVADGLALARIAELLVQYLLSRQFPWPRGGQRRAK